MTNDKKRMMAQKIYLDILENQSPTIDENVCEFAMTAVKNAIDTYEKRMTEYFKIDPWQDPTGGRRF